MTPFGKVIELESPCDIDIIEARASETNKQSRSIFPSRPSLKSDFMLSKKRLKSPIVKINFKA
jgi:hypothetical protein